MSPLLANIYLDKLDTYMESNYLNLSHYERRRRREQEKGNYLYVRYADDFLVLCNGTKAEAQTIKEEIGELLSNMGLTLSEEKTKITHITEGFKFLGYWITRSMGHSGKMTPEVSQEYDCAPPGHRVLNGGDEETYPQGNAPCPYPTGQSPGGL